MNFKKLLLSVLVLFVATKLNSQTTHTITLPSTGTNTINVTCAIGDIILFHSTAQPLAIRVFRNPTPNYTVTPTGTSTAYTVTATDTSYSSIVSVSPISTCVGKITLTGTTGISAFGSVASVLLYPNPANDLLSIKSVTTNTVASIKDAEGRLVKRIDLNSSSNEINVSELEKGLYFVEMENKIYKFIIAK